MSSEAGDWAGLLNPDAVTVGFSDTTGCSGQRIGAAGQLVLSGSRRAVRPWGSYKLGAAGTCERPLSASGSGTGETSGGEAGGAGGGDGPDDGDGVEGPLSAGA